MDDRLPRKPASIRWTQRALDDVEGIVEFIAKDRPVAARRIMERLLTAVEGLAEHPLSGRVLPELGRPDVRELIRGRYRIAYRVRKNRIEVLTLFDSRRQLPSELDR